MLYFNNLKKIAEVISDKLIRNFLLIIKKKNVYFFEVYTVIYKRKELYNIY
jgi:hypothetical protein